MRKMKKINGFLVVRFNDREKRDNPTLGSFGVIDGSQYTGDLDFDLDAFEYTDADLIEVAVEQARGLDAEEDVSEEAPTYTVAVESAEGFSEEEVYPKAMTLSWAEQLKTQIKSKHYPDVDPRTAAHELAGTRRRSATWASWTRTRRSRSRGSSGRRVSSSQTTGIGWRSCSPARRGSRS